MHEDETYPVEPTPDEYSSNGGDAPKPQPEPGDDIDAELIGEGAPVDVSPVASAPVAPPVAGPTASGVRCIVCRHDLSGTAVGAVCPECGAPVTRSLGTATLPTSGKAITSMVLGICSVVFSCACAPPVGVIGVVGLVYYFLAKRDIEAGIVSPSSSGMNVAGLVTSIIGLVVGVGTTMLFVFFIVVGGL